MAALEGVQQSDGPGRTDPGWFHPSTMSNECDAYWAFQYLGAPSRNIIKPQLRRVFDNGSGRDEYLKRDAMNAGVSLIEEFSGPSTCTGCGKEDVMDTRHICIPSLHIRGDLDDWAINPVTKRRYVVDFKTMREPLYNDLKAVLPSHHIQVQPYMVAKDTYEGFVLYENKNNQEQKCMQADFDQGLWTTITNRIESILTGLHEGYVKRTPGHCSSCPFAAICSTNQIQQLIEESGISV